MRSLENVEYAWVVKELQAAVGKHFSNIYRIAEGKYRLKVGDYQIIIEPGVRLNLAKFIEEPIEPDHLVNLMKQRLDNAKLTRVEQVNGDRLVVFTFDSRPHPHKLVLEGFGKGNLILVCEDKTIVTLREEEWSDREIKRSKPYKYPKSNVSDDWQSQLSDKFVITALLKLPLGKEYAKEILHRCAIDEQKKGTAISEADKKKIDAELKKMQLHLSPIAFQTGSASLEDFGLTKFSKHKELQSSVAPTLSELIDTYYLNRKEKKSEKLIKLEKRLEEQKQRLSALGVEENELKAVIEEAYAHYGELESVLAEAKQVKLEEIESKLKKFKAKIKDRKNKEVEIEL
jgi:predicted ribosome quality control (RQC) complex YloA/Tae2 family protein